MILLLSLKNGCRKTKTMPKKKLSLHKPNEKFRKGQDEFIESCITLVYQQHAQSNKDHIDSTVDMQKLAASEKNTKDVAVKLM